MRAMIPGSEFELRKAPAAATQAVILVAASQAVILEAIPEAAVAEVIPTLEAVVEDPMGGHEIPDRTLKTTPKCSR
jgi:hypothetical protein